MKRLFLLILSVASFLCQVSAQSKVYEIKLYEYTDFCF